MTNGIDIRLAAMSETISRIERLIVRHNEGDDEASRELMNESFARLERLARKIKAPMAFSSKEVETGDIMSELWLRLSRAFPDVQFTDSKHFFRLAAQHIRFTLIDLLRKTKSKRRKEETLGKFPDAQLPDAPSPDAPVEWEQVMKRVDDLPDALREIFELIFVMQEPEDSVSRLLGISDRSVRRRYREARMELFRTIESE